MQLYEHPTFLFQVAEGKARDLKQEREQLEEAVLDLKVLHLLNCILSEFIKDRVSNLRDITHY